MKVLQQYQENYVQNDATIPGELCTKCCNKTRRTVYKVLQQYQEIYIESDATIPGELCTKCCKVFFLMCG